MYTALRVIKKNIHLLVKSADQDRISIERFLRKYKTPSYLVINDERTDIYWIGERDFITMFSFVDKELDNQFAEVIKL